MLDAKMKDKLTSVVLCAVLVFYAMVPISDFQKPQKAEAIAPAIAAVSIFGTALAAAGVYVAGTTAAGYDANLGALYDGFQTASASYSDSWAQYVQDQGSFDAAMQSCVTEQGNISLQTLSEHGFFDSVDTYTAYCVEQGTVTEGASSLDAPVVFQIGDYNVTCGQIPVPDVYQVQLWVQEGEKLVGYREFENNIGIYRQWYLTREREPIQINASGYPYLSGCNLYELQPRGTTRVNTAHGATLNLTASGAVLSSAYSYVFNGEAVQETTSSAAVLDGSVNVADTVAATPTVQPFEPTDEMLAAGYTASDILGAIEDIGGNTGDIAEATGDIATDVGSILTAISTTIGRTLNEIKTGVNGLETAIGTAAAGAANTVVTGVGQAVGALGDVLGDISTTLDNVWNGAQSWWADVLAWLGATPLAQLIAQIIAAVNAGVMTLEGAISAVQSWISSGVAEIVGAIEGIGELIPGGASQEEPAEPQTGTGVALPPDGLLPSFELELRDKAPFAYIVAFLETFQDAANTFSSNPSFYLDLNIPSVDENGLDPDGDWLQLDAGEWLNYTFGGGVTIAFMIRVLVTASICAGLIKLMYNAYLYAFRQ